MLPRILKTGDVDVKMWLQDVEDGAMEQILNLSRFPFAYSHIVVLPDCHQGFGMPIGGVMATEKVIVPNAVGVDIGCGMTAVRTSGKDMSKDLLKRIMGGIRDTIPLGFKHHKNAQDPDLMPSLSDRNYDINQMEVVKREYKNALYQVGTLGGGNHFIELQKARDDQIWIMVHSGSRNIGKQVADFYNQAARRLNQEWKVPGTYEKQLAYLPLDSKEGQSYLQEMNYCIEFAFANRKLMLDRIMGIVSQALKGSVNFEQPINIAHNFASLEQFDDRLVVVHRKGATQAHKDQLGIIPGSQGTNSYIVKGKGNKDSFNSCSHGAGRIMGRKQAQRELDINKEKGFLENKNILHSIRGRKDLDEAPGAYKDISLVMEQQKDLVEVIEELQPLAVIKG